jgi:hypothetical protein
LVDRHVLVAHVLGALVAVFGKVEGVQSVFVFAFYAATLMAVAADLGDAWSRYATEHRVIALTLAFALGFVARKASIVGAGIVVVALAGFVRGSAQYEALPEYALAIARADLALGSRQQRLVDRYAVFAGIERAWLVIVDDVAVVDHFRREAAFANRTFAVAYVLVLGIAVRCGFEHALPTFTGCGGTGVGAVALGTDGAGRSCIAALATPFS